MRRAVLVFAAALASISGVLVGQAQPKGIALGERFELRIGESVQVEVERLQIGFEDVSADSRCPKGEQCIREGDATVRVWLQKASEAKATRELHTSDAEESASSSPSYEVRLLRLDPYPVTGRRIPRADYVATLEVIRGSSASPDIRP